MNTKRILAFIISVMMLMSMLSGVVVYAEGEGSVSYPGTTDLFDSTTDEGFIFATDAGRDPDGNPYSLTYSTHWNKAYDNNATNGMGDQLRPIIYNNNCTTSEHEHPYYIITAPSGKVITGYSVSVAGANADGNGTKICAYDGETWNGIAWRNVAPNLYVMDDSTGEYSADPVKTNVTYTDGTTLASSHAAKYTSDTINGDRSIYATWTGLSASSIKLTLPAANTGGSDKANSYGLQTITYADAPEEKIAVSIPNASEVEPTNTLRVKFGKELATSNITKDMFTIDDAVVKSISFEENNTVCVLKLETPLLRGWSYSLHLSRDIESVDGLHPIVKVNFKTKETVGTVTVTETNDDFSKVYEKSPGVSCSNFWNDAENPDPMEFGVGPGENPSYVVYHNNGNTLSSFSFYTTFSGGEVIDRDFKFAVSEDGETYTNLELDTNYEYKWCTDRQFPSYNYGNNKHFYSTNLPDTAKYLKVIFPTYPTNANAKQATLGDGEMVWSLNDEAMVMDATNHPVSKSVKIIFNEDIDPDTVSKSSFTVPGFSVTNVNVKGSVCTVTLSKTLASSTMYTIEIGEGVKKLSSGESISEDYRKLSFYTQFVVADNYSYVRTVDIGDGGMAIGFVVHPLDSDLVYLRTDVGGLYRWDADARYWEALTDVSDADLTFKKGCHAVAVDPYDVNVVYAALGQQWYKNGGVYKSNDQGTTWEKTSFPAVPFAANSNGRMGRGESLVVDPNNTNIIYCGTPYNGMYISRDKAKTWTQVTNGIPVGSGATASTDADLSYNGVRTIAIDNLTGNVYAGVTNKGVYESKDQGSTWTLMSGSPTCPSDIYAIDSKLYVSHGVGNETSGISGTRGLYVYDGSSWTLDLPSAFEGSSGSWWSSSSTTTGSTRLAVAKNDNGEIVIAVFGDKANSKSHLLYIKVGDGDWKLYSPSDSTDKSREDLTEYLNWSDEWKNIFGYSITAMEFSGANNCGELWIATGKGVHKVENVFDMSDKFVAETNGIEMFCVKTVKSVSSGEAVLFVGGMDFGPFRITDTQNHSAVDTLPEIDPDVSSWIMMTKAIAYCEEDPNYVARISFATNSFTSPYVAVSEQNGKRNTWETRGWDYSSYSSYQYGAVALSSGKNANGVPDMIAFANNGTSSTVKKYSSDFGKTWYDISGLPTYIQLITADVVTADRKQNGTFYVYDPLTGNVYRSTDGGKNFSQCSSVIKVSGDTKTPALVSNPYVAGELLLGVSNNGLYKSTDFGSTFTKVNNIGAVSGVDFGKNAPNRENATIFVLGYINGVYGLFRSDDGTNFVQINDPERNSAGWVPHTISADLRTYGKVYVGTQGRGVWEFSLKSEIPETYIDVDEKAAYVYENSLLDEKLALYAATYNSDGSLKSVVSSKAKFIDKYGKLVVDVADPQNGEYIRYFLWSKGTMTPLAESR